MTGRELILYIVSNGLEDEEVFKDGKILGFMTETEAAVRFNVGVATVRVWADGGYIPSVKVGNVRYIPANAERPKEKFIEKPDVNDLYKAFCRAMEGAHA